MADSITFRDGKPAIDVKDRQTIHQARAELKALVEALPENVVQATYEGVQERFWREFAPEAAERHGYGDVYSEGRSSGWLLVDKPPVLDLAAQDLDGTDLDTEEERLQVNRAGWEDFEREIDQEMEGCRSIFADELREALAEFKAIDRKVKAVAAMSAEEVRDAASDIIDEDKLPREELDRIVLDYGDPTHDEED